MHDPMPVYPHPALTALRDYLGPQRSASPGTWAPAGSEWPGSRPAP
ncbi:MAG: hypothetical protein WBE95_00715 [Trebonia sp.]